MERKPQFSFDQLYVPIFTSKRVYKPDGTYTWEKISNHSFVTGIEIFDGFLQQVQHGSLCVKGIAQSLGISPAYQAAFIKLLTGMHPNTFAREYMLRRSTDLLRYTSLSCDKIAHLCRFKNYANFSASFFSRYKVRPVKYRQRKQTALDKDFYGL